MIDNETWISNGFVLSFEFEKKMKTVITVCIKVVRILDCLKMFL